MKVEYTYMLYSLKKQINTIQHTCIYTLRIALAIITFKVMFQNYFCSLAKLKFTLRSKCYPPVTDNCWHLCKCNSRSKIKKNFLIIFLPSFLFYHVGTYKQLGRQVDTHTKPKAEQMKMKIPIMYENNTTTNQKKSSKSKQETHIAYQELMYQRGN